MSTQEIFAYGLLGLLGLIMLVSIALLYKGIRKDVQYKNQSLPDVEGLTVFNETHHEEVVEVTQSVFNLDNDMDFDFGDSDAQELFESLKKAQKQPMTRRALRERKK